jgi:hypothetical protein
MLEKLLNKPLEPDQNRIISISDVSSEKSTIFYYSDALPDIEFNEDFDLNPAVFEKFAKQSKVASQLDRAEKSRLDLESVQ